MTTALLSDACGWLIHPPRSMTAVFGAHVASPPISVIFNRIVHFVNTLVTAHVYDSSEHKESQDGRLWNETL